MLSLNSIPDKKTEVRELAAARPRGQAIEEREARPDFQAMVVAAVQPAKPDLHPTHSVETRESQQYTAPKSETSSPAGTNNSTGDIKGDAIVTPKAGHEAAKADPGDAEAKLKKPVNEAAAAEPGQPKRASHDMLQALGLATMTARTTTAKAAQATQTTQASQQSSGSLSAAARLQAVRTQTATTTLNILQKAPDAILIQNDGLKRLSEKIGIGFLSKFAEKLNERPQRAENGLQVRSEISRETLNQTSTPLANKAGHNNSRSESDADSKNNQRGQRGQTLRSVSRETSTNEGAATLRQTQADQTVTTNPANHESSGQRLHQPTFATDNRTLTEAAAGARATDSMRAAVENPLLRPELVRQFNEVMTRAQVMVTDAENARFSVKLFPRELGRMEIDLKLVDGEMRGKIVVENEEVKTEMQNFLQNRENQQGEEAADLSKVSIEVRSESQNAQTSDRTADNTELLQNLVTRSASVLYEAVDVPQQKGNALYA